MERNFWPALSGGELTMAYAGTITETYTETDIEIVIRRFQADLIMIAQSSRAITEDEARDYAHDVEVFAKLECLDGVDITLLSSEGQEIEAARYTVDTNTRNLAMERPGGVMWRHVPNATLRIVLIFTKNYDKAQLQNYLKLLQNHLNIRWCLTNVDLKHSSLNPISGRYYVSNGWTLSRKDYK